MLSAADESVSVSKAWGDEVLQGTVKTKTVFPALILSMLHANPTNGYGLMQRIGELGGIFPVNPNSVYPLLRRLEERGFVEGRLDDSTRRRSTVYHITPAGEDRLQVIKAKFRPYLTDLIGALERLRGDLYGELVSPAHAGKEQP